MLVSRICFWDDCQLLTHIILSLLSFCAFLRQLTVATMLNNVNVLKNKFVVDVLPVIILMHIFPSVFNYLISCV